MSTINPKQVQNADATSADEIRKNFERAAKEIDDIGLTAIVSLTSAQVLALSATPIVVLPAPGVGKAYILRALEVYKPAGTAYGGIATTEDLTLKYTNAAGTVLATVETTGFLDQATAQLRSVKSTAGDITPVDNAPIVAHIPTGEITTGNTPVNLRISYRVINTVF